MVANKNVRPPMGRGSKGRVGEKPKDFKETTKKLLKNYLAKYKIPIVMVILFAIGSTIFAIVGPKILGNATTEIFNGIVDKIGGGSGIDFGKIGKILLTLLGLYALSAVFSLVQGFTMTTITQKITYKMRNDLVAKINKLPMKYFDKRTHGETLSIITNDIDTLSQNLNQSITQIITSICTIIGILIMMFSISWSMTVVSLIILPVTAFLSLVIVKHSQKYFKAQQDYLGHVNGQVEEIYGGHTVVKAFNGEEKATEEFIQANNVLYRSAWRSQFLSGLIYPVTNFIGNVGYVAVAILGGYLTIQGKIAVGDIQSFIQYNKQFVQPITQIAQISGTLQAMIAAAERVFEFLEEPEEIETAKGNINVDNVKGNVVFDHVNFGYDPEKTIINDFCANIKDGQKIAIVGPTGAGKTTMVKLLMRFYDTNSGSILIDGAVAILGGYLTIQGKIAVGDIQSFIQYNKQFVQPITQIAQISGTLQAMIAAAERVFEFLEEPEEIETAKGNINVDNVKGNVVFDHVNFGYDPEKTIINDFCANIKDGQKIAIVGPTGAGKTTMVKLLMRFYDTNSGSILIDGHNIKDFERGNLRKLFGMVLQDTWLFSGSVEDNIKYGNENATDSEVIEAAKAAHVHHFIKTLPNGYKSDLNEETSNVSAGQKQLLTIARVILADPKILILDEATSSIDTRTEQQIQFAMDNLMKGRTSFIIAHRLSTIKNADLILVMNHGDIVEQGTHEELLEKDGFYAGLYNSQFEECNDEIE